MKKLVATVLVLAGIAALGAGIILQRSELLDNPKIRVVVDRVQDYLPFELLKSETQPEEKAPRKSPETERKESKQYTYTDEQVQQAMREVLEQKRKEQALGSRQAKSVHEVQPVPKEQKQMEGHKYMYRIELQSGAIIYTEEIPNENGTVRYIDSSGLEISINPDQVLNAEKIRVRRTQTIPKKIGE